MGSKRNVRTSSGASLSLLTRNKQRRREMYIEDKKARSKSRREERFRRKKEENKNPELRQERLAKNQPITLEKKRKWDDVDDDSLGVAVDLQDLKRKRIAKEFGDHVPDLAEDDEDEEDDSDGEDDDDSLSGLNSSAFDSSSDEDEEEDRLERIHKETAENGHEDENREGDDDHSEPERPRQSDRGNSEAPSVTPSQVSSHAASLAPSLAMSSASTSLDLTPESLVRKFPTLFPELSTGTSLPTPKLLVTTSLNATIHNEARMLASLFPNSTYIPRSAHRYAHKYSLREICRFAHRRGYTAVLVLREDLKRPHGLDVAHLPSGPTFHFSVSNWVEGRRLPGHGNPTGHVPELLLNNFRTPLGLLTARLFQSLFPPAPELAGRQVVTLHNQRDYIFVKRHRYVFRDRRETEKSAMDEDGREMKWARNIRVGLQELGPKFTLKLRRIDKGIGRAGSEGDDKVQWEWKPRMEKDRKRFNL